MMLNRDNLSAVLSAPSPTAAAPREDNARCTPAADVMLLTRSQLQHCRHWPHAFGTQHKDRRYYEILEDTIHPEFEYLYLAVRDRHGEITSIQPVFLLDLDILAGMRPILGGLIEGIRRAWPRFLYLRTMMVGCVAGEGQLDDASEDAQAAHAALLAREIPRRARALGVRLVVLKEFPKDCRTILSCFVKAGFTRIPSMPLVRLGIAYESFDDYMRNALNSATRSKLRKKFKATDAGEPIALDVTTEIAPIIEEVYPLYLNVYNRSKLHFEKLSKEYFLKLAERMPDKVRFFVWRRAGKAVAFGNCLVHSDTVFAEYLGLDYSVALKLHLYHYVFRDLVKWSIANGYQWFQSSALNYDPKLHLRYRAQTGRSLRQSHLAAVEYGDAARLAVA